MVEFSLYHIDGLTDLQKLRDEAEKRRTGDSRNPAVAGMIHMHKKAITHDSLPGRTIPVQCNAKCERYIPRGHQT